MHIRQAAAMTGLTPRAIRYYEQTGLLPASARTEGGYRFYSGDDIDRLRWIAALREWGIPLSSIAGMLDSLGDREAFLLAAGAARQSLYEQWLDASAALKSLDQGMAAWQSRAELPSLDQLNELSRELQQQRKTRGSWTDGIGWDVMAAVAGEEAPVRSLPAGYSLERYRATLEELADWLDPLPGETGADLGCGTGNLTRLLTAGGARLIAVDVSSSMLSLLARSLPQIETRQGNLLALPLPDRSCHFAASSFVLQHLRHDERLLALQEMRRVLLPGGRLAIAAPLTDRELQRLRRPLAADSCEIYSCGDGMLLAVVS
ncbi:MULTISPECIES: methyltransferase domain-containing protein [unclassified Paenibacillus]|uniref:methyltransferase domain-containing protein n=1 Tax=unclassified Paenibacillus TaxID=185978 RepID=UPI000955B2A6|nr:MULTISPECIES: methyltransferase domain-containing protein [unclassified Paenibacillus]ASS65175.1 methyltransferase domain-containing protein [Paenibacillus sp. RUD330]SIQ45396.1 putative AdoMet-dependent methyltransferase [Paenibacillus sp. RU4X]SIQ67580.1 putative AdoMet-dependent methyltransferase [Paenibacillus sp. RU4T]